MTIVKSESRYYKQFNFTNKCKFISTRDIKQLILCVPYKIKPQNSKNGWLV